MTRQESLAQASQQLPSQRYEIVLDQETGNRIFPTKLTYPSGDPINLYIVETFYGPVLTDGGETARQLGRHKIHDEQTLDVDQIKLWLKVYISHRLRAAKHVKLCEMGSDRLETDADNFADALSRVLNAIVEIIEVETWKSRQAQSTEQAR